MQVQLQQLQIGYIDLNNCYYTSNSEYYGNKSGNPKIENVKKITNEELMRIC